MTPGDARTLVNGAVLAGLGYGAASLCNRPRAVNLSPEEIAKIWEETSPVRVPNGLNIHTPDFRALAGSRAPSVHRDIEYGRSQDHRYQPSSYKIPHREGLADVGNIPEGPPALFGGVKHAADAAIHRIRGMERGAAVEMLLALCRQKPQIMDYYHLHYLAFSVRMAIETGTKGYINEVQNALEVCSEVANALEMSTAAAHIDDMLFELDSAFEAHGSARKPALESTQPHAKLISNILRNDWDVKTTKDAIVKSNTLQKLVDSLEVIVEGTWYHKANRPRVRNLVQACYELMSYGKRRGEVAEMLTLLDSE
jgi:hypothetical protein